VPDRRARLGLRENLAQFSLLVAVNLFVGAMVGLERSTLPVIGREDFGVGSNAAVLAFLVAFGLAKAATNLGAGGSRSASAGGGSSSPDGRSRCRCRSSSRWRRAGAMSWRRTSYWG
jgi:hypothetical protein